MRGLSIEGYAVVSGDGMIADRSGHMPHGLKCDADARFFTEGLNSAALVVHGRHSHEEQGPASDRRRRLFVSNRTPAVLMHPNVSNAWVWNPASMPFENACRQVGVTEGKVAVSGGTGVFGLFLNVGFDVFHLSRAGRLVLPGGRPVFPEVPAKTPEQVLTEHGLKADPVRILDAAEDVTLVSWRR
jgi:hypothetical protein